MVPVDTWLKGVEVMDVTRPFELTVIVGIATPFPYVPAEAPVRLTRLEAFPEK